MLRLACFLLLIFQLTCATKLAAEQVLVYVPGSAAPLHIIRELSQDPGLKGYTLNCAAKWRQFERELGDLQPDWIITSSFLLDPAYEAVRQYSSESQEKSEPYLLISLNQDASNLDLQSIKLGLLQEMPSRDLNRILESLYPGGIPERRPRLAARPIDVIRMLGLEMVDVVLIAERHYTGLDEQMRTGLHIIGKTPTVWVPRLYHRRDHQSEQVPHLAQASLEHLSLTNTEGATAISVPNERSPWLAEKQP